MPIISKNPRIEDNKIFDRLSVQVAISPVMKATDVGPSFAIQFKHYRKNDEGQIETPSEEQPIGFGYSAALPNVDQEVEDTVRQIMESIARLAELKGI
jgi:hypothetical protein